MNYQEMFRNIPSTPKKGLNEAIFGRIMDMRRRQAKVRMIVSSAVGALAAILSVPASMYVVSAFKESGFWQYLSLLFSDSGTILVFWKELSLSLLETFPFFGSLLVLGLIFIIVASFKYALENGNELRTNIRFA